MKKACATFLSTFLVTGCVSNQPARNDVQLASVLHEYDAQPLSGYRKDRPWIVLASASSNMRPMNNGKITAIIENRDAAKLQLPKWTAFRPSSNLTLSRAKKDQYVGRSYNDFMSLIQKDLNEAGYDALSYYSFAGGIVATTRLEYIRSDGSPRAGNGRWTAGSATLPEMVMESLYEFPRLPKDRRRVFSITLFSEGTSYQSIPPKFSDIEAVSRNGLPFIPYEIGETIITKNHQIMIMVYQTQMDENGELKVIDENEAIRIIDHLDNTNLRILN